MAENSGVKRFLPGIYVLIASVLWATDATVRNNAFTAMEARTVGALEHFIALLTVMPLVLRHRDRKGEKENVLPRSKRDWLLLAILGIGGSALAGTIFTLGVERLGPSLAAVFTFLQPIAVLGLAFVFLREKASSTFYFMALWVIANSVLISFPSYDFEAPEETTARIWAGAGLATIATLIWGGTTVAGKALLARYSPAMILLWRWVFATGFLAFSLLIFPEQADLHAILSNRGLVSVLFLGIVAQTMAYLVYYQGLRQLPVRVVTFIEVLYPILGVFIPIWTRGENTSVFHVFGSITLLLSIAVLLSIEYPKRLSETETSSR